MSAGRYAPSPTGQLHLGNLRTALLTWLFARSTDREVLLRIEDLDRVRAGAEAQQLRELEAMGLSWDGPAVRQSDRTGLYDQALALLDEHGLLYECYCSRKDIAEAASAPHPDPNLPPGAYPGTCRELSETERARRRAERPAALRIDAARAANDTNGAGPVHEVTDVLHGSVSAVVDDFVVRRNDGAYAYNLAVVIDDLSQGIDQVVRGDDLLSSTPRQDWLARLWARLAGLPTPATEYAHVPLVLNEQSQRLAKRDGAVTLEDLGILGSDDDGAIDTEGAHAVRARLLESVGLPGESLEAALDAFDPSALPTRPWIFRGLDAKDRNAGENSDAHR